MKAILQRWIGFFIAAVLAAGLSTVNLKAGNLLVDPGFELQTPAEQGGWMPSGDTWWTADAAHSGNWSIAHFAWNAVSYAFQWFPAAPGSQWRMTGYGMPPWGLAEEPAFGLIQVSFFDIDGNDLGTLETSGTGPKISNPVDWGTPLSQWQFLDTGVATAPEGTAFIHAFTLYVDLASDWQGVCFDDVALEVLGVTHGQYVSSIALNAGRLQRARLITAQEAATMVTKAAKSAGGR